MSKLYKSGLLIIAIIIITMPSLYVYGQVKSLKSKKNKPEIGFQSSGGVLYNTGKQSKINFSVNNSLVFKKPLSPHIKAEALINFNIIKNQCCIDKIFGAYTADNISAAKLSLPVTIQYYPLKKQNKLQPYIGAGVQYDINMPAKHQPNYVAKQDNNEYPPTDNGTKYISIIFTQGVTYKINTKIQLRQSFHFIPGADKTLGLDIGVGYTIH